MHEGKKSLSVPHLMAEYLWVFQENFKKKENRSKTTMKIVFFAWRSGDVNDWECTNQNGPMLQSSHPVRAESPCVKNQDKQLPLELTL